MKDVVPLSGCVCPICLHPFAETASNALHCENCGQAFPVVDGIPILVKDPHRHLKELEQAIEKNPAWYQSDQIAWYEEGPCRHHLARRRRYVESVFHKRFAPSGRCGRLLDLGCGDGANTRWLTGFAEETFACDYNLLRLKRCIRSFGNHARLHLAHIFHLPYPDAFFDAVFFNHVLEHIPDDERALQSVCRILKPGGFLILGLPNEGCGWWQMAYRLDPVSLAGSDHVHFYTAEEIKVKAIACGFNVCEIHPTGWGPPHWKWDERLRHYQWIDNLFERIGRRFLQGQSSSLYLTLQRPGQVSGKRKSDTVSVDLYEPAMEKDWENLVQQSAQGWLFHKRDFIEMTKPVFAMREFSLAAYKAGRMVAILPLTYTLLEAPPKMGSLAFGAAGPVFDPDMEPHEARHIGQLLMERAVRLAKQEGCKALEVALPPAAPAQLENRTGVSPLDAFGFAATSTSSYVLNLAPDEEALFACFNENAQRNIRKAEKAGMVIRPATRDSDPEMYYRLHGETYDRTGVLPHPRAYFEGIFSIMTPKGFCLPWAAEWNDQPLAYLNVAVFKESAYFWTNCSSAEGLKLGANHLLHWHAIRFLKSRGIRWYEVGEAFPGRRGDKLAGLDEFKRSFGGERRPFHKGRIDVAPKRPSRLRLSLYYLKQAGKALIETEKTQ